MIERKAGQRIVIVEILHSGTCVCGARFQAVVLGDGDLALTHEGESCEAFRRWDPDDFIAYVHRAKLN